MADKPQLDPRSIEVMDDALIQMYREMSGYLKLKAANALCNYARDLVREEIKSKHPDWVEQEVNKELARRYLNREIPIVRLALQSDGALHFVES